MNGHPKITDSQTKDHLVTEQGDFAPSTSENAKNRREAEKPYFESEEQKRIARVKFEKKLYLPVIALALLILMGFFAYYYFSLTGP